MRYTATIPHGIQINCSWIRYALLRELNGYDEELLAKMSSEPYPYRTTVLLSRITRFPIHFSMHNSEMIRRLVIGDRIALLLHMRRMIFGDKFHCVLLCHKCRKDMSLDLSISSLLQPVILNPRSEYIVKAGEFTLKLRPITGADIERVLSGNEDNRDKTKELARSCIIYSEPPLNNISDELLSMISSELERIDPQADLILNITCPSCSYSFQTPFNVEKFIFDEIAAREKQFEKEIHWIAFNYHWSEDAILSLSMRKRKRYVDLINRTLAGEGV